jgi:hypothetical protein
MVGDGVIRGKIPREIKLELVNFREDALTIGSEVSVLLRLKNVGREPITLPWSIDPRTAEEGQSPRHRLWETGRFRISLRNGIGQYLELKNTSQLLYGSGFVPGSLLTLKPGEWITAQASFRVAETNQEYEKIEEGHADLALEWVQETFGYEMTWLCSESTSYFLYDGGWSEHPNRVTVKSMVIKRPEKARKPTS